MAQTVDIVTLGCSKNLVDSERLKFSLEKAGYVVRHDPSDGYGDIVIINTCGFIGDAKEESINTILEYAAAKLDGELDKLFVMGCLSQRYAEDLPKEIEEVDAWYGKFDYDGILKELCCNIGLHPYHRSLTTPSHYSYIKISEGCDRRCSYCAIPIITGRHKSRPMEEILDEIREQVAMGVKEFLVIAQELTFYGIDLYHKRSIAELVERMAQIDGVEWIKLHYAYPTDFPLELLDVMGRYPNICRYLDIALQHASDTVLERMHRHITREKTENLISEMRRRVPDIHIRTTFMVGYPGETDKDFDILLDFVKRMRFDRMGAFAYSEEEGTYSAKNQIDDVDSEIKQQRLDKLMALQQEISAEVQQQKVGSVLRVIVDHQEGDYYVARTEFDSPEVDPEVLIPVVNGVLESGMFYNARIVSSDDFDLYAEIVDL